MVPSRTKTYAAPRLSFSFGAPTTRMSPSTASASPKPSPYTPLGAGIVATSTQPSPPRRNMCTLPGSEPGIGNAANSPGRETKISSPETAAAAPKPMIGAPAAWFRPPA